MEGRREKAAEVANLPRQGALAFRSRIERKKNMKEESWVMQS
jgi:hypothetical protein